MIRPQQNDCGIYRNYADVSVFMFRGTDQYRGYQDNAYTRLADRFRLYYAASLLSGFSPYGIAGRSSGRRNYIHGILSG